MKAAAVAIMGLGFNELADCQPHFLTLLLDSAPRGVVENSESLTCESAWRSILGGASYEDLEKKSISLSNIPITNPTIGNPSLDINTITLKEELDAVYNEFNRIIGNRIFVASINLFDRERDCNALEMIDQYLEKMYTKLDSFMFFSPYGGLEGNSKNRYGVYMSSVERPQEDQTIKLDRILPLILKLNNY